MKKLIEGLKRCKGDRKRYKIIPVVKFAIDNDHYYFSFFPTIKWQPWIYRYPNSIGVIDIQWLIFHIAIGKWIEISCQNCNQFSVCNNIDSYCNDIIFNNEPCPDFELKQ